MDFSTSASTTTIQTGKCATKVVFMVAIMIVLFLSSLHYFSTMPLDTRISFSVIAISRWTESTFATCFISTLDVMIVEVLIANCLIADPARHVSTFRWPVPLFLRYINRTMIPSTTETYRCFLVYYKWALETRLMGIAPFNAAEIVFSRSIKCIATFTKLVGFPNFTHLFQCHGLKLIELGHSCLDTGILFCFECPQLSIQVVSLLFNSFFFFLRNGLACSQQVFSCFFSG